ncbi:MAG: exo-alpha-sialidase [Deltaproteobacteria bacterium]|nr:exo-alpha-sialidase [Deltaproteobacteria bacterium]
MRCISKTVVAIVLVMAFTVPALAGGKGHHWTPKKFKSEVVNVSNDLTRRFGMPLIAVNPTNPNNIVIVAVDSGYTLGCQDANDPDCELIPRVMFTPTGAPIPLPPAPRGVYATPGFATIGIFVSFDRGKTWTKSDVSGLYPAGHPEIISKGESPIMFTPDGTLYIGFNALNWGDWEADPPTFLPSAGIGIIKSIDGGLTWSDPVLTGTPADFPYGCSDLSMDDMIYVVSGLGAPSFLGPRSTGDPDSPILSTVGDRWLVFSDDGVNWTEPQRLGGSDENGSYSIRYSDVQATHGEVATAFSWTSVDENACQYFVDGPAPCVVFQTTTDVGYTWNRHRVPYPFEVPGEPNMVLLAADPSMEGHFAVAVMNTDKARFFVYQTHDSGNTWSGPTTVAAHPTKTHFFPNMKYSPEGVLGLIWRINEGDIYPAVEPYSIWTAISLDGGTTFSEPLEVSKTDSSPPPPGDIWLDWDGHSGDHGPGGIAIDGHARRVYVVWGDWSPGERAVFFRAIKFSEFRFNR